MKNKLILSVQILLLFCASFVVIPSFAQGLKYDEEVEFGNGLIKVKSNGRYGLLDENRKLKLPVEFQDMEFQEGYAVIVYYGSLRLYGVVDSLGVIKKYKRTYFVNPNYPYFSCGMICVSNKENEGKWGYMDSNEKIIPVELKGVKNGFLSSVKVKGKFVFDCVAPFCEDFACVYTEKTGWHHIDKNGKERFLLNEVASLRTSVYHGESVICTAGGIKVYEEAPDWKAGVKMHIDDKISDMYFDYRQPAKATANNGDIILFLDDMLRAEKIKRESDSLVFIAPPVIEPEIITPIDSFILGRDIEINVEKTTINANAKGKATIIFEIKNKGDFDSGELNVSLQCNGINKDWRLTLVSGQSEELLLFIPARFSVAEITRLLEWSISTEGQKLKDERKIVIKRYRPVR